MTNNFKGFIKLTEDQLIELSTNGSILYNGETIYYSPKDTIYLTPEMEKGLDLKYCSISNIENALGAGMNLEGLVLEDTSNGQNFVFVGKYNQASDTNPTENIKGFLTNGNEVIMGNMYADSGAAVNVSGEYVAITCGNVGTPIFEIEEGKITLTSNTLTWNGKTIATLDDISGSASIETASTSDIDSLFV